MQPLTRDQVAAIGTILKGRSLWRDYALFRLGIDSMLRASDLVRVWVEEVVDHNGEVVTQMNVKTKKTGVSVPITLSEETRSALRQWLDVHPRKSKWLFPSVSTGTHITETWYRLRAKDWFDSIGLDVRRHSTHSIRRTKATLIYEETHNLKAVSELLGHKDTKMTERYIGVGRREALEIAAKVKI